MSTTGAIDRGREAAGQLNPFAPGGRKSGEREGDGVGARTQIDDPVLSAAIGDHHAHLLDEGRARRFYGDAGQQGP
jgi:hypothetical protein